MPALSRSVLHSLQVQRVVNHWLLQRGFSVGICDALAPRGTMDRISTIISEAKGRVHQVLETAQVQHIVPVSSSVCLCWYAFILIHRFHSISFTRAQGIPKYKIGFGREKDGRVGERLGEGGWRLLCPGVALALAWCPAVMPQSHLLRTV